MHDNAAAADREVDLPGAAVQRADRRRPAGEYRELVLADILDIARGTRVPP